LNKVIVADSGPLIAFAHLEFLAQLPSIVGTVIVPKAVFLECIYVPSRPDAIAIQFASDNGWITVDSRELLLDTDISPTLGEGEKAAIQLAKELNCPLLLDDKIARRIAQSSGLSVIGTAGVLLKGKQMSLISAVAPLIDKLQSNGYYFSSALVAEILNRAGEV
jgi:predicted nucleic acid-binding protein